MLQESKISILVPMSPIKSHPDISIISHTIETIRFHFPTAALHIMMDGVRAEQESYRENYEKAQASLRRRMDGANTRFWTFDKQTHQVGMTREVLKHIETPLIMFVEQDMPIVINEPIEFEGILKLVLGGRLNLMRLMHEAFPLACHEHLYRKVHVVEGIRFRETMQWSQRPHVASTDFYRKILDAHFSLDANSMIEDCMHGVAQDHEWEYTKMAVYLPNDRDAKRTYHTDGREGDKKYDELYTY